MNKENLKLRIKLEIEKSEESFKAAKVLFDSGLYDESVSSAYYSMFHMVKALLLTIEKEPSTHHGLVSLFGLNFIKPKLIEGSYNDLLIDAKESREAGDYDAARKFTKEEAFEKVENAEKFNKRILNYLKDKSCI
ncbi:MAG: HEPN domain-containing protein [Candidatus Margulisiibacteriota bacterium]